MRKLTQRSDVDLHCREIRHFGRFDIGKGLAGDLGSIFCVSTRKLEHFLIVGLDGIFLTENPTQSNTKIIL